MAPTSANKTQELKDFFRQQSSHLDHQLKGLDDRAESLDHKVEDLDKQFKSLEGQVGYGFKDLDSEVKRLNREIHELDLRVKRLEVSHKFLTWALLGILGITILSFSGGFFFSGL